MSEAPSVYDAALAYAAKLPARVLPVVALGKRPAIAAWGNQASCDAETLARWFLDQPGRHNIGLTPDRGVFVLDIDTKPDDEGVTGFDTLARLEAMHGKLPATLTAETPTGGLHLWFRCNPAAPVRSIVGGAVGLPGLDIRAHTGQVVVWPSARDVGMYRWRDWNPVADPAPAIAEAPAWLVEMAGGGGSRGSKPSRRVVAGGTAAVGKVARGGRNAALVSEAGALRHRGWGYDAILEALTALSEMQFDPPCEDKEIHAVARWAMGFEADEAADVAAARGADAWVAEIDEAAGDAGAVLAVARRAVADPSLSRTETEALIKRASKAAGVSARVLRGDLHPVGADEGADVRIIEVRRSDFAGSVDSALAVLPHVPGLRQRSGELVEAVGGRVSRVDQWRLGYLTASAARWRNSEGWCAPDSAVLQAVLSAGTWPGLLDLAGIAHQPCLMRDGSLGTPAGFEACYTAADFPEFEGAPAEALAELRGLMREFPFATARDEAAAVAAILTAAARPMLRTAPGFLINGHDLGTGKTYLAELLALFASPTVEMLRWAQRAEEQDKLLLSLLMQGRPVAVFDNLMRDWASPTLAAILTGESYTDRLLGASEARTVSTRCLWVATGNNIKAGGDLSRRVITVELDAGVENPLTRRFASDPVATVRADRGRWVMIALKVLQGFVQSGARPDLPPLASFGEWSGLVRGALVASGVPDIIGGVVEAVNGDDDKALLGFVLAAWHERYGSEPTTLRDVWHDVRGIASHDLRLLLLEVAGRGDDLDLKAAGGWLGQMQGRVANGLRLAKAGRNKRGSVWAVQRV